MTETRRYFGYALNCMYDKVLQQNNTVQLYIFLSFLAETRKKKDKFNILIAYAKLHFNPVCSNEVLLYFFQLFYVILCLFPLKCSCYTLIRMNFQYIDFVGPNGGVKIRHTFVSI